MSGVKPGSWFEESKKPPLKMASVSSAEVFHMRQSRRGDILTKYANAIGHSLRDITMSIPRQSVGSL